MQRALLAFTLIFASLLIATEAKGDIIAGIAEQQPPFLSDPLFHDSGIKQARLIVAVDELDRDDTSQKIDDWLTTARRTGVGVLISFGKPRFTDKSLPTVEQYSRVVARFRSRYPWVKNFSTWNEPNIGQTRKRPRLIARYWQALESQCSDCQVLAAEVVDTPNIASWLERFLDETDNKPRLWGLHNYIDTNLFSDRGTSKMLEMVKGRIWLSETGGIIDRNSIFSRISLPEGLAHQVRATEYLLDHLVYISDRIERVYLYHWQAEPDKESWDSAFVTSTGKPRTAYEALIKRIDPKSGKITAPPESGPTAPTPPPAEKPIEIIEPTLTPQTEAP